MTLDVIRGLVRHGIGFAGALLVARGVMTEGMVEQVTGAGMALASVAWSIWDKRRAK